MIGAEAAAAVFVAAVAVLMEASIIAQVRVARDMRRVRVSPAIRLQYLEPHDHARAKPRAVLPAGDGRAIPSPARPLEMACARTFRARRAAHHLAVLLVGESFRARFRVPRRLLAGCRCAVAPGRLVSALARMGQSRLRRTPLYFLSAALVDVGSRAWFVLALERRPSRFHRARANAGRRRGLCSGSPFYFLARGRLRGAVLRGQSLCAARDLYAERFCGAVGFGHLALCRAFCLEACRGARSLAARPVAYRRAFRGSIRRPVAFQCSCRSPRELQLCFALRVAGIRTEKRGPAALGRSRHGAGASGLLYLAGRVRAALGEYRASAIERLAAFGKFSLHEFRRSRARPL